MKYYFELLIFILTVMITLYKPKELVSLHDSILGKLIMVLIVIALSLKSCLGGVLGAIMFMTLETQKDIIEGACDSKNCKVKGISLANAEGKVCDFMCTLQLKRYGSNLCKVDNCGKCCIKNTDDATEGFTGDDELSDNESSDGDDNAYEDIEHFDSNNFDEQSTMKFVNDHVLDDSEFGNMVRKHQAMAEGDTPEAKYNDYLNQKMRIDKFKDNYEMKKKLYHKNKSIENDIKELEENNKLQIERQTKLKNDMERRNKEILQAELTSQIKSKIEKATNPIPKDIQNKKLDDFLNSKYGKNNDLLKRVAELHGSNTRHDNGNIKTGLNMDIDETGAKIDSMFDHVTDMVSNSGLPMSQTPFTDNGENGLQSFLKSFN